MIDVDHAANQSLILRGVGIRLGIAAQYHRILTPQIDQAIDVTFVPIIKGRRIRTVYRGFNRINRIADFIDALKRGCPHLVFAIGTPDRAQIIAPSTPDIVVVIIRYVLFTRLKSTIAIQIAPNYLPGVQLPNGLPIFLNRLHGEQPRGDRCRTMYSRVTAVNLQFAAVHSNEIH